MDNFGIPDRLCEMDESDLNDFYNLQMELDDMNKPEDQSGDIVLSALDSSELNLESYNDVNLTSDWMNIFDDPIVNDKMMSEALSVPVVRSEHSYSVDKNGEGRKVIINGADGNAMVTDDANVYIEVDSPPPQPSQREQKNIVRVTRPNTIVTNSRPIQTVTVVKQEPRIQRQEPIIIEARRPNKAQPQSLLKPQTILLTNPSTHNHQSKLVNLVPKREPVTTRTYTIDSDEGIYLNVMPMTPPGSSSSDSEHGSSPLQSPTPSPIRQYLTKSREVNPMTAIYSQPIPTSGVLILTEEEKRTLISEGYPIPAKLPLTKIEERNLKKVRRKIKNKISAQESRRKRKEYMDHLEKKMEDINRENADLQKRCEQFESSNATLMSQLSKLQNILRRIAPQSASTAQTGILFFVYKGVCVMVLVMCFAVFFGHWSPSFSLFDSLTHTDSLSSRTADTFTDITMKHSRTLLTFQDEEQACGNEPWPIRLVRQSYESFSYLISGGSVDSATGYSNDSVESVFLHSSLDNIRS